jgi:hypothetical protein
VGLLGPTLYDYDICHVDLTDDVLEYPLYVLREHIRCAGDAHVQPRVPQEFIMRGDGG